MRKVLLVLCSDAMNGSKYENILSEFQKYSFDIHEFTGIKENNFHFDILDDIFENLKLSYPDGIDRIAILSDIKEAVLIWFRAYNSVINDFILYLYGDGINAYKNILDKEVYKMISSFTGVEEDVLNDKILIVSEKDHFDEFFSAFILMGNNCKYFSHFEKIDFVSGSRKPIEKKVYYYKNKSYTPQYGNNLDEKIKNIYLNDSDKPILEMTEDKFFNVFNQDIYIFFLLIIGIYKLTPNSFFKLIFNFIHKLKDSEEENKKYLIELLSSRLSNNCSFIEKVHIYAWISILKERNWIFYEPIV